MLEQRLRADELGATEVGGAEYRAIDVRFGGEIDDRAAATRGALDRLRVADVADDELDAGSLEVRRVTGVGELVEHHDVLARPL